MNFISNRRARALCCLLLLFNHALHSNAGETNNASASIKISWPPSFDLDHMDASITNHGTETITVNPLVNAHKVFYDGYVPYDPNLPSVGIDSRQDPRQVNMTIYFLCEFTKAPPPTLNDSIFGEQDLRFNEEIPDNVNIAPGETKKVHFFAGEEGALISFAQNASEARCWIYNKYTMIERVRLAKTNDRWTQSELADPFKTLGLNQDDEKLFPRDLPPNPYIDSVAQAQDTVLASTNQGLYRAFTKDKIWQKLPTPPSMPPSGTLAQQGPSSPLVVYYPNPWLHKGPAGLFVSKDFGKTWDQASPERDFTVVFTHPNGSIFAFEKLATASSVMNRLAVSKDLGKTWRIITGNWPGDGTYWQLSQDPDHPDLVCYSRSDFSLHSETDTYQADDQNYQTWRLTTQSLDSGRISEDKKLFWTEKNLFCPVRVDGLDSVVASLSTFFALPFLKWGNGLVISHVQIETEQPNYTFHPHHLMNISVEVKFVQPRPAIHSPPPLKFADIPDETIFWGLRVLPENNNATIVWPKIMGLNAGPSHEMKVQEELETSLLHDAALKIVNLDETHPYSRTIDLSKFYDFSKPGNYQVQFFQLSAKWGGSFSGQVFQISITN
jgi:hypothetical protein